MSNIPSDLMSTKDVEAEFGVKVPSLRNWIARGDIPGWRFGPRKIFVSRADILSRFERIPVGGDR